MDPFKNEVIDVSLLPDYQEASLTAIMPSYWNVIRFNFFVTFSVFAALIGLFYLLKRDFLSPYFWIIPPVFVSLMGLIFYALMLEFKKRSYAIRTHDIIYKSGLLSSKSIIIPFQRIQHVAINEGFVSRHYGLVQLQIFTAGGAASDIKISGLLKEHAERIKEQILQQISTLNKAETPDSPDPK